MLVISRAAPPSPFALSRDIGELAARLAAHDDDGLCDDERTTEGRGGIEPNRNVTEIDEEHGSRSH